MTTVSVPNPDPIGDFEKKVRSKKNTNPYAKKTPTDDGDYQEEQKEKKNTKSNTRTKFKASGGRVTLKNGGRVAKGCGAVMPNRRKKTKYF